MKPLASAGATGNCPLSGLVRCARLFRQGPGGSGGFTLIETLLAVALTVMAVSIVGSSIFQALSLEGVWRQDVVATREVRHAASWFAGDALNATATDLVDGAPPAGSVALSWDDASGTGHSALYSVSGSELTRDFDGAQITLARQVVSTAFSLSGKVLTFELTVVAERGGTETATLNTYLRMLR